MNITFCKLIIAITFNIFITSVFCQNVEKIDSHHDYNIAKSLKNSLEHIEGSKYLKLLSARDRKFIDEVEYFFPRSINTILPDLLAEDASDKCLLDLQYVFESLQSSESWALKMVDSFGKPSSGILLGNVRWLGEYNECRGVYAPPKENTGVGDFHGKYCTLQVLLQLGNMSLPLSTAVCLPDSCSLNGTTFGSIIKNFSSILKRYVSLPAFDERIDSVFNNATLTCKATSRRLTAGAIAVILLLSIIALLAVIGSLMTAYEYFMAADVPKDSLCGKNLTALLEKCKPFFNCFCLFTNGEKILNTSSAEGQLPCLHGIRFFSMCWVILCHTYLATFSSNLRNPLEAQEMVDHWTFQIILNGFFSVDTFFLLSGFLVAYLFFKQADKLDGKFPWLLFYVHRYIRLTPVYLVVMLLVTFIKPFLGSGPLWPDSDIDENCKANWWWNLLYINNFVSSDKQCTGWAWYLALDMQFHVITPLFLITLWKWPKIGYSVAGLFLGIQFITNFAITFHYNLISGLAKAVDQGGSFDVIMNRMTDYFDLIYHKPYNRIGPYLVGLVLAYYLCTRKDKPIKLNPLALSAGWLVALITLFTCQFVLYHENFSRVGTSFYNALTHVGFASGVAWIIFVCVIGQGGAVNSILSWHLWLPFSRLSYCAYLFHPIIHQTYFMSTRALIEFSHTNVVLFFLGLLLIAYTTALLATLLLESPVIRLEKFFRNKSAPKEM
ncbi:Nose resistant to fluoxetine protein 6 [Araneus ventricosus]|uniref:Nose resistant to fluoxetine protein 6 n=1 Tax=Araneus ventricosus TaxID=182803 RepID=A0A4Y2IU81_ARAVE|nr:Nose resistant to fluoxetine protein 6 [Araneus ventricosus]